MNKTNIPETRAFETKRALIFSHELTRMFTNQEKILYKDLSYKIIGLAMRVHRELGFGFLEKVYENSMMVLFRKEKIPAVQQASINVSFESEIVGHYVVDILVDEKII